MHRLSNPYAVRNGAAPSLPADGNLVQIIRIWRIFANAKSAQRHLACHPGNGVGAEAMLILVAFTSAAERLNGTSADAARQDS